MEVYTDQIKYLEDTIDMHMLKISELQKIIQTGNIEKEDVSETIKIQPSPLDNHTSDQNDIWDRIRHVHKEQESEVETPVKEPEPEVETPVKEPEPEVEKNIIVNKFSKFPNDKKLIIMANIFNKAKKNINKLSLINDSVNENMQENIQLEADRLLKIFLNEN